MSNRLNPMKVIQQMKQGQNPQQIMMQYLENKLGDTPMGANLLELAKNNRTADIEKIARNLLEQRGLDFDAEFTAFKQMLGL